MQLARQPPKKNVKKAAADSKRGGLASDRDSRDGELAMPWGANSLRQVCSDGRKAIAGYVIAAQAVVDSKVYPPPTVPPDFNPLHRFNSVLTLPQTSASLRGGAKSNSSSSRANYIYIYIYIYIY